MLLATLEGSGKTFDTAGVFQCEWTSDLRTANRVESNDADPFRIGTNDFDPSFLVGDVQRTGSISNRCHDSMDNAGLYRWLVDEIELEEPEKSISIEKESVSVNA